jgi:hypothetical protein
MQRIPHENSPFKKGTKGEEKVQRGEKEPYRKKEEQKR